jgi:hypothetical protein
MDPEKLHLKWKNFENNINLTCQELRGDFCDVTLVSEDNQSIEAHKIILAASSPVLKVILRENKHSLPLIYMRGTNSTDLTAVVDFIYNGEVNICKEDLSGFLALAEDLQIKGLTGTCEAQQGEVTKDIHTDLFSSTTSQNETNLESITELNEFSEVFNNQSDPNRTLEEKELSVYNGSNICDQIDFIMQREDGMWTCKVCGKKTKLKGDMKRHAELHIEGLSFPCKICGKSFKSSESLRKHLRSISCQKEQLLEDSYKSGLN